MSRPPAQETRALRVPDALWHEVSAAAAREGVTTSEWVRRCLADAVAGVAGGGPAAELDPEYGEAVARLMGGYGIREPRALVRMCVLAALRRDMAGINPFRAPEAAPAVVTVPAPPPRRK